MFAKLTRLLLVVLSLSYLSSVASADDLKINMLYLEHEIERAPVLSNLVSWPDDEGEMGAVVGTADNNTTGKFLKQDYKLEHVIVSADDDIIGPARQALQTSQLIIANVSATDLLKIANLPEAKGSLIFNTGSTDTSLRDADCHASVLHTLPSRAMLTDSLMQFLKKRRWDSVFLLEGNRPVDRAYAESVRRSAKKYRVSIDHEKRWIDDSDMRRSASSEIPVFTQARKYDVVVVADEDDDFGQYVLYNTWLPRPVAGTAGVEPVAWHRVVEQWGAAQLQSRFEDTAKRPMTGIDYAAWAAVRTIGEAVTRLKTVDVAELRNYILSDEFSLAGFKGTKMNYRKWNGQLRQPVPLIHPQSLVALAPIDGFLHHTTELDTLGLDQPESACRAMEQPQ